VAEFGNFFKGSERMFVFIFIRFKIALKSHEKGFFKTKKRILKVKKGLF